MLPGTAENNRGGLDPPDLFYLERFPALKWVLYSGILRSQHMDRQCVAVISSKAMG